MSKAAVADRADVSPGWVRQIELGGRPHQGGWLTADPTP